MKGFRESASVKLGGIRDRLSLHEAGQSLDVLPGDLIRAETKKPPTGQPRLQVLFQIRIRWVQEVVSSNLASPTIFPLAQTGDANRSVQRHFCYQASSDDAMMNLTIDVCESEVAACIAIGELDVIQTQEMQDRRMEICGRHHVFHSANAQFVG